MTMKRDLLSRLARQWVSPMDALHLCGCMSLAQRVSEWRRDGVTIIDKWIETPTGKRVKAYRIVRGA